MSKPYTRQQWVQQQIAKLAVTLMTGPSRSFAATEAVEIAAEIWETAGAAAEKLRMERRYEARPKDAG